ncbi:hypothetical protein PF005_g31896 [Phytophthora fragariae]|uniref:RxLR effector protein n=1 Tax=Phytophthora fragariae TaxID=53985 RepID=A0A6A3PSU1_9STRA|nr:hypothetical protein PF003_g15547 [Phytophthora fragariae]KAE8918035.1 hypothetical protein PF009_g31648 [Phytophthora fragariae]KAE9057062.1 hypothetical protein PF010_g31521 [Phytophthora fragariae]KAE9057922.1 hypothetical protein PF007_g31484 [Phytophthora fragariae]KAE9071256.1 hypothetical protein PF006_g29190 [Phytophthora fragariae]
MRLLSSAFTVTVWVAALLGTATPVQAHYPTGSIPGSLVNGEDHEAGGFQLQHAKMRPHGPVTWPRGKQFGAALRSAAGLDGLPEPQVRQDQADRKLRLRGRDDKP